jgi:hypothetical protein
VQAKARSLVQVFEQAPDRVLRPFIQRFLVVEFPSFHCDAHLPDTSPVAAFSFRGGCRIDGEEWAPPAAFTGLRERLRAHEHCREHAVLLATFTPAGATAFLHSSMLEEFSGITTDLAGILGRQEELSRLSEQLAGAQKVRLLGAAATRGATAGHRRRLHRSGLRRGLLRSVPFHQRFPPGNRQPARRVLPPSLCGLKRRILPIRRSIAAIR